jgi:hypothetical protein
MTESPEPYNPLDKDHLAESIAREFFKGDLHPLPPTKTFAGAGIYAIYYGGDYPLYADISASLRNYHSSRERGKRSFEIKQPIPIYIGKSDPPGSRKGLFAAPPEEDVNQLLTARPRHIRLWARLKKHSASISLTKNLKLEDFKCRYMLVDEIWVALGEARLVAIFQPVWNVLIEGFGSNVEGSGRERTARSVWDILHPGRKETLGIQVAKENEAKIVVDLRTAKSLDKLAVAIRMHFDAKRQFAKKWKVRDKLTSVKEDESGVDTE